MEALIWSICATIIVSLIALIGIISLSIKEKVLKKILLVLVGFSAGALMGGAFLHLLPEALEKTNYNIVVMALLSGFIIFFIMEKFLKWHHCHKGKCDVHTFTYMILFGDSVHNFIDGIIIAASFIVSVPFGIITTIAIIAHEIPQEIGDFAVLIYGGFTKFKALLFNFLTALTAVLGAVFGYFLSGLTENIIHFVLPFAAGGFIYIAACDLIPELHKEVELKKSLWSLSFFIMGILFMWLIKFVFEH